MKYETLHGRLFVCQSCRQIHFEYNNFALDLKDLDALAEMLNYLKAVRQTSVGDHDEQPPFARRIMIPFHGNSIRLLVNEPELDEIISLAGGFIVRWNEAMRPAGKKEIPLTSINGISSIQLN